MKFSWNYLQSFFPSELNQALVLERLTLAGLEVEQEQRVAPDFSGVVVAEVLSCSRHPDADKLSICQVALGADTHVQIVCGASNVASGVKVACATVGAVLPDGMSISPRQMRGITSYGMLCSSGELGLPEDSDGLLLLPADAPVGCDIREYLALNDQVIELKITPNRGDCLSYTGLVREISALTGNEAKPHVTQVNHLVKVASEFKLNLSAKEQCPHYVGLVLTEINNAQSPLWLQQLLLRSGIRSVSAVVDITNYVMLVLGQPLHAFDLNQFNAAAIQVRLAHDAEELRLLDGTMARLQDSTLVISDGDDKPLAIAGVMGGKDSSVTAATKAVFLESAYFIPAAIHGQAKKYAISSDAAFRYERGVDPQLQNAALNLAAELLQDICGAAVGVYVEAGVAYEQRQMIELDLAAVNRFIGQDLDSAQMVKILRALGCVVVSSATSLQVTPPSYRFDLSQPEDLIEEIIRVYGYDKIEPVMPQLRPSIAEADQELSKLAHGQEVLMAYGFNEIISYAFIEDRYLNLQACGPAVKLLNPIAGLNTLRSSLIPGLLKAQVYNNNRGLRDLRLFELARVFFGEEPEQQPVYLSALMSGQALGLAWHAPAREVDFYDLRLVLEEFLAVFGAYELIATKDNELLHPGRSAKIYLQNNEIGFIGQLHPRWQHELALVDVPYIFELNLSKLGQFAPLAIREVSKYQKVSRDLAFVVAKTVVIGELVAAIRQLKLVELIDLRVFDVFSGGALAQNEQSVAINFIFQASDKTLTEEEINANLAVIKRVAMNEFAAQLR